MSLPSHQVDPTAVEQIVLSHLATGMGPNDMALAMGLTPSAVRAILEQLCWTYGVTTRVELLAIASATEPARDELGQLPVVEQDVEAGTQPNHPPSVGGARWNAESLA